MGLSRSPAELRRKFERLADDVADLDLAVVKEASQATKEAVLKRAPARLSGVGKRGAKLGVRYNVSNSTEPKSLVFATGPFQLIENNTKAHRIPKERKQRKGARRRLAVIPGVGPRAWAMHPGTKGQHPWAKGVKAAEPEVAALLEKRTTLAIRRIFG